jgi:DNA replication and repair protein RecF
LTTQVAELGGALVHARVELLELLATPFRESAAALGLDAAALAYEGDLPTEAELAARLDRDLERGSTGLGPHLHDISIVSGDRDLRSFGSQGEQRIAVLALLLGEAGLIADRREEPPLLLLDDVLSELDPARRESLADLVRGRGQTLITATTVDALPVEPDQLLEVSPGEVRWSG